MDLTPQRKQERDRQALVGLEGQTREFRAAVRQALNTVNLEIAASEGKPQIDAVTAALTGVLAEFVAMQPSRTVRRLQLAHIERDLKRMVALRTSSGGTA